MVLLPIIAPTTVALLPTDDIWVYPHASDPRKDPFLRVWGAGGASVVPGGGGDASYAYLRFDLTPYAGKTITGARLVVHSLADPAWSLETAKAAPLEARALAATFAEATWKFGQADALQPTAGKEGLLGDGFPTKITPETPVEIALDLKPGLPNLQKALGGPWALALTSAMDPSEGGQQAVYKLYSKDEETPARRPRLELVIE